MDEKHAVGVAAAGLVEPGQLVGLGTGSTVEHFVTALATRGLAGLRCVATSPATEAQARSLGLPVEPFSAITGFDIAVDGTDQVSPERWLVKGGGAAHTREKVVAAAAERFVVIGDSSKPVHAIVAPIPLELLAFGLDATLHAIGDVSLRDVPPSPDGGVIADYLGPVGDPAQLAARLDAVPGVIAHGLFAPELVTDVMIAHGRDVRVIRA